MSDLLLKDRQPILELSCVEPVLLLLAPHVTFRHRVSVTIERLFGGTVRDG